MPDVTRKTISATQASALWNVSPYTTRWMLWQHFAKGVDLDSGSENARMSWGKKMQPLVIQQTAEDMRFDVIPNDEDTYHRRGLLGCTRDATIICPDRGPGALETKCVFDYRTWMADWDGGKSVPRQHEIQLQQQMLVGDDEPYNWGVIAAWVAGDVHYFERDPIFDLWDKLNDEALAFFKSIDAQDEPDPFGAPIEIEWLTKLLPTERGKVVDLSGDARSLEWSKIASAYVEAKEQENAGKRIAEPLRAKLLGLAKDAEEVWLPGAIRVRIGGNEKSKRLNVYIPEVSKASNTLMAG